MIWQDFRSSAAARGLSARMVISDQPLEARLRAYESANRYDRPCNALHLILICCWEPMGANSILTLELISGLQLAQDLPNGESSSAVIHRHRQLHPFELRDSWHQDNMENMVSPGRASGNCHTLRDPATVLSATCLTPSPLLFTPSPHKYWMPNCKSLGLRTHGPSHPWSFTPSRSAFPLSFFYNPIMLDID